MTTLIYDALWKLMLEYTFELDIDSITEDLRCILCRKLMCDAYQSYCGCQFCRSCIVVYLKDGDKYCCGDKDKCREERLVFEINVLRNVMLNRNILKSEVHCPNRQCSLTVELGRMEDHLIECNRLSISNMHDEIFTNPKSFISLVRDLKTEVNVLKEDLRMRQLEISTLRKELFMKESAEKVRLDRLIETVQRFYSDMHTNVVTFIVDKFSARKAAKEEILSPYFYSHTNGYKLRLKVYPCGRYDGEDTHLSLGPVICNGEFDDVLPWPCVNTFTIAVINQCTGGVYWSWTWQYSDTPENLKYLFKKFVNTDNFGCLYPRFVSHVDLQTVVGLVVDDSVTIRCAISRATSTVNIDS